MRPFAGANELGLKTAWRWGFVGPGTVAEPVPGVVYLDVGGSLREGIVDHHSGTHGSSCTAELLFRNRETVYNHLMRDWIRLHAEGRIAPGTEWRPVVITHEAPDWDSVASVFLAMALIEDGDFPPYAAALVHYVREVDQGRYSCSLSNPGSVFATHLAYFAMQSDVGDSSVQMQFGLKTLRRSMELIAAARQKAGLAPVRSMSDLLPGSPGAADWLDDPDFAKARDILSAERAAFAADLQRARTIEKLKLPAADGGDPVPVPAFVAGAPMQSRLHKYWVRAHGYPFFICPFERTNGVPAEAGSRVFPRVILSVDPNFEIDGRKPNLLGLGYRLERLEVRHRQVRHGGHDDRSGTPRFGDGYCENDDPWYDGRAFGHTIVDAPHSGTLIPYEEVVQTACETPFWEVPVKSGSVSLVWRDWRGPAPPASYPLKPHAGLASTLEHFRNETREAELPAPEWAARLPEGCSLSLRVRSHPQGTCAPFLIANITAVTGATLEDLVEARSVVVRTLDAPPEYSLARIAPDRCCSDPSRIGALLRQLNGGEEAQTTTAGEDGELLLFNNRDVVLRQHDAAGIIPGEQTELEVLLYLAFLNETIAEFSRRISSLVPPGTSRIEAMTAEPVCEDFLRFQARYYQIDVCRSARGRLVWERLASAVSLPDNYAEVRSELDRLAQLEAQIADRRRARAESLLQIGLYAVALFGVYQTVIGYYTGRDVLAKSASFWMWIAGVTLAGAALYAWAAIRRRGT